MDPLFPINTEQKEDDNDLKPTIFPSFSSFKPLDSDTEKSETSLDCFEKKSFNETAIKSTTVIKRHGPNTSPDVEEAASHTYHTDDEDCKQPKKKKKKEKNKHKKKKPKQPRDREKSPENVKQFQKPHKHFQHSKVFMEEIRGLESKDAYRIDRKCNKQNWTYESLYKGDIPNFYCNFHECLGSVSGHTFSMRDKPVSKGKHSRYYDKENARAANQIPVAKICQEQLNENTEQRYNSNIAEQIIKLCQKKAPDVHNNVDVRLQLLDADSRLYVEGKGNQNEDITEEISVDVLAAQRRTAAYNKKLREEPTNIPLWLEFVNYQDECGKYGTINEDRKASKHLIDEKKIAVMKKAIDVNPGSIELKLKYLALCKEIWEPQEINKELENMLFVHPTNIDLWKHYLFFNQCRLSIFCVSRMCKLYQKCLKTLVKYSDAQVHTVDHRGNVEPLVLDIVCMYCSFLKQVGHMEKAIATYQALIEFNLFCPAKYKDHLLEERVILFESFWDSGVSRVGEKDAKGWEFWTEKNSLDASPKATPDDITEEEQSVLSKQHPKWLSWSKLEQLRSKHHWLPWRPDLSKDETEDDCEDVDRLVLFDDVSPYLVDIKPCLHFSLVLSLFSLLDVTEDGVTCNGIVNQLFVESLQTIDIDTDNNKLNLLHPQFVGVESFMTDLCFQLKPHLTPEQNTKLVLLMLDYRFKTSQGKVINNPKLLKSLKSTCRNILKEPQNRENVDVWMKYVMLLWLYNEDKEAQSVVEMAIMLLGPKNEQGIIQMYRVLCELLMAFQVPGAPLHLHINKQEGQRSYKHAVHALVCLTGRNHHAVKKAESTSSTLILKSRKKLESAIVASWEVINSGLNENDMNIQCFLEHVKCMTLFEYCSTHGNIESAETVLNQALTCIYKYADDKNVSITDLKCNEKETCIGVISVLLFELFMYKIRIVHYHMMTRNYPLRHLRSIVDSCLEMFPKNQYFLQTFLDIEKGSYILRRLDSYFSRSLSHVDSYIPVLYAVYSQLQRIDHVKNSRDPSLSVPDTGVLNRIRTYLEKALDGDKTQHCPLLWRLYLGTEVKFSQLHKATNVFYRAVQKCPWSKVIYLDAVSQFGENKLQEIVDLMTEKELRIQIPLEEIDILTS